MNRATRGQVLFDTPEGYGRFICTLQQARTVVPMRVLAHCAMPNHWHLVLWPVGDDDLTRFMRWLSATHAKRLHRWRGTTGTGAVYQGRYRAVPVHDDTAFYRVVRYVERNPVRARLAERADRWLWSSASSNGASGVSDSRWPVPRPPTWQQYINDEEPEPDLEDIRARLAHGQPIGPERSTLAPPPPDAPAGPPALVKDDGLVRGDQHAVVEVPPHRP